MGFSARTGASSGTKQDYVPYTLTRSAADSDPALTALTAICACEATRDVPRFIGNKHDRGKAGHVPDLFLPSA